MKNDINLETSSAFDINLIQELHAQGLIDMEKVIVCNGFKKEVYIQNIVDLFGEGFHNVIPVLDNKNEFECLNTLMRESEKGDERMNLGIRIASEEEPKFDFYTSRLGIRYNDMRRYGKAYCLAALKTQLGQPIRNAGGAWITMKDQGAGYEARYNATWGFRPFPASEVLLSAGVLKQNDGWTDAGTAQYTNWK